MWERYCRGVQAIVYVVDAADHDGLDSGRQELHELLQKPSLARTPLLVLGNKNDLPGALSTTELIERLDLKVRSPVIAMNPLVLCVLLAMYRDAACAQLYILIGIVVLTNCTYPLPLLRLP